MDEEKLMLTCPNNACKKVFAKALIAINPHQSSKPYNACPYCLTEITMDDAESNSPESLSEIATDKEESAGVQEKTVICKHHLGYLKERELKQQMPEECILCTEVIDCMLGKRVNSQENINPLCDYNE